MNKQNKLDFFLKNPKASDNTTAEDLLTSNLNENEKL